MAGRLARIQARSNAEAILTAAGVSLLQDHGIAAAGYPDTLRIRPTGMGWMVGWCRSDPVNAVNIYVLYKPPPWLASLGSRLARLPGHGEPAEWLRYGYGQVRISAQREEDIGSHSQQSNVLQATVRIHTL
ncbi:hypothetical protein CTAM01_09363 [Colletotrichum tamarilloi]|uniref:Uncharacterized protein n=1 Tax=Colletotrichum tamarilloi TaxID=1209934 RepID=A0ABQ9R3T2_9PEZI|nr:uncharacterized protein CTAM01_09363 [Colletotrichum tamarilloi]KAK1493902.1 hypothetical protein CTAM01_09363 [Colletotrichum tamarilloi]